MPAVWHAEIAGGRGDGAKFNVREGRAAAQGGERSRFPRGWVSHFARDACGCL